MSCYEKFIVDVEILRMLKHEFKPLEVTEESLAFDAHEEVGSGGHFLGAAHTLMHFRDCFYRPLLSSTDNFDRWTKGGGLDATARAAKIWRETLEAYEQPPIDDGVRSELRDYVARQADRARRRAGADAGVLAGRGGPGTIASGPVSQASPSISPVACTCSVTPVAEMVPVTVPDHGRIDAVLGDVEAEPVAVPGSSVTSA